MHAPRRGDVGLKGLHQWGRLAIIHSFAFRDFPLTSAQSLPRFLDHAHLRRPVMWKTFGVFAFIVLSPTLAHAAPQTHDEWYVNSGRYINGQVPSYDQVPS